MSFNFAQNTIKNFNFLKSFDSFTELYICGIQIKEFSGSILIPLSKIHFSQKEEYDEYIQNSNLLIYLFQDKDSKILGKISIQLDTLEDKLIFSYIELDQKINENLFYEIIYALTLWAENTLLSENIEYKFKFEQKNFSKPQDMILTAGPMISHYEKVYCNDAVRNGWNKEWSKYLDKFEYEFSQFIDSKYAIATSSCTGALHLSLLASGVGLGDEVIVPELTWVATASAVSYTGAKPVFADIDINTWCIETTNLEKLLSEKTKAIMPVHLYGNPVNMDEIIKFANKNNLKVIEDAAPAIGATFKNKKVGSFGDFGCFSFQGAKLLVTGEGGMVVTDDEELFNKFKKLWDHGRVPGTFWIDELGFKHKMSNIQAAFGLGQLENIETLIEAKRRIHSRYKENLDGVEGIKFNIAGENTESIYWMTSILLNPELGIERESFRGRLKQMNIDSRPVFPSISQYPIWGEKHEENKNAKLVSENGINLPSGVKLSHNEIDYISETIINLLQHL